jgi:hypothetical protein
MKTVQKHIDYLRHELKKVSDDTLDNLSDEFLYSTLLMGRMRAIKNDANRNWFLSEFNKQVVCVSLKEDTLFNKCNCSNVGCKILKSETKVPQPLSSRRQYVLKVKDMSGNVIGHEKLEFKNGSRNPKVTHKWDIVDGHLVIFLTNTNRHPILKKVVMHGVMNDPLEAAKYSVECDSTVSCYDPKTQPFPIDDVLQEGMYKITMEMLMTNLKSREDVLNDDNEERALQI